MLVTAWEEAYNLAQTRHCPHLTQEGRYADLRQPREVHSSMVFKP